MMNTFNSDMDEEEAGNIAVEKIVSAIMEMAIRCVVGHPKGPGITEGECRAWRAGARDVHSRMAAFADWLLKRRSPGQPMFARYDADGSGHMDINELREAVEHWQRDLRAGIEEEEYLPESDNREIEELITSQLGADLKDLFEVYCPVGEEMDSRGCIRLFQDARLLEDKSPLQGSMIDILFMKISGHRKRVSFADFCHIMGGAAIVKGCSVQDVARAAIQGSTNPKRALTTEELAMNVVWRPKWYILHKRTFNRQQYM